MKIMNKFFSMAALALVGAVMTACSSDDNILIETPQPQVQNKIVTLTTTISLGSSDNADPHGTNRALNPTTGAKTFTVDDQVAVFYKNGTMKKAVSNALTAGDISADGKTAKITVTLDNPTVGDNVRIIYPAAMATTTFDGAANPDNDSETLNFAALATQDGTLNWIESHDLAVFDGTLADDGYGAGMLPGSISLTNRLAVMVYTLKDATGENDITSTITGMAINDGTNNYSVTRSAAVGPIYVAIKPTTSSEIKYVAIGGTKLYTKSVTSKNYAAGNMYPLGLRMVEINAIPGKFNVSSIKQVYFAKGNLRYVSDSWSFFEHQYDYYTSFSTNTWDKFGWSTTSTTYGKNTSNSASSYSGDFRDWGNVPGIGSGWYTLSNDEWEYLFNTRSGATVNGISNARFAIATINTDLSSVNGIIFFPDGVNIAASEATSWGAINDGTNFWGTKCTTAQWGALEAKGCVFLPAAGQRDGSSVLFVGEAGYYWSSTASVTQGAYAFHKTSSSLFLSFSCYRHIGHSVRLVRNAD